VRGGKWTVPVAEFSPAEGDEDEDDGGVAVTRGSGALSQVDIDLTTASTNYEHSHEERSKPVSRRLQYINRVYQPDEPQDDGEDGEDDGRPTQSKPDSPMDSTITPNPHGLSSETQRALSAIADRASNLGLTGTQCSRQRSQKLVVGEEWKRPGVYSHSPEDRVSSRLPEERGKQPLGGLHQVAVEEEEEEMMLMKGRRDVINTAVHEALKAHSRAMMTTPPPPPELPSTIPSRTSLMDHASPVVPVVPGRIDHTSPMRPTPLHHHHPCLLASPLEQSSSFVDPMLIDDPMDPMPTLTRDIKHATEAAKELSAQRSDEIAVLEAELAMLRGDRPDQPPHHHHHQHHQHQHHQHIACFAYSI